MKDSHPPKTFQVGVSRRIVGAGLAPARVSVRVGADDRTNEAAIALGSMLHDPRSRFASIENRAAAYRVVIGLFEEVDWVRERLQKANWNAEPVDLFALLALERGLDLLDTQKYIAELHELAERRERDAKRTETIREKAGRRARLPEAAKLKAERDTLIKSEGRHEAIRQLREKYGVTASAIRQRIAGPAKKKST
jgi:hypothetical protein